MNKLWILGIILGTIIFGGCGSDKTYYSTSKTYTTPPPSPNAIPTTVLNKFHDIFPSAHDVKWNVNDGLYKADFKSGDTDMNASFTPDGNVVKVNG